MEAYFTTKHGRMHRADSLEFMRSDVADGSIDLIMTSPPFGLVRKKSYGNVDADGYVDWFRPFGVEFFRALKSSGSLVIDIGGSWNRGQPTRSLYHFELLIMLCRDLGFHLAQEMFWWNPSKLPSPAEWVTVRRVRVKDAVNCVWWLSKTPWPKASNRRVLIPYSKSMKELLDKGYKAKKRPSGHEISKKFSLNNNAAIPPNLLAVPNTESNSCYVRHCKKLGLSRHPARFPSDVPEFFVRLLTDPEDLVFDPFAGSCVTGEVADRLGRRWICCDTSEEYLAGAVGRFPERRSRTLFPDEPETKLPASGAYAIHHPSAIWSRIGSDPLPEDGGRTRSSTARARTKAKGGPGGASSIREAESRRYARRRRTSPDEAMRKTR